MKYKIEKDEIKLIPECDYDCYIIGRLSVKNTLDIFMTSSPSESGPKIIDCKISINLLTHILSEIKDAN